MTPDSPDNAKARLRARMREALDAMSEVDRHHASHVACTRLVNLDAFRHASVLMLYMSLATEVDTTPIAIRAFQTGKTVCVPRVDWQRRDMVPVEVSSFDDHFMETDEHGIRTPRGGRLVVPSSIDLVVVPGLAFDAQGGRLGRGGGFYDRVLGRVHRTTRTIGLAFDVQIVDEVPADVRDMTVGSVVTERRVTHARRLRSRR
jgi:5-formyltetrahydrofolate cyclo-ligase